MNPEDAIAALSQVDLASAPQERLWPLLRALGATTEEVKLRLAIASRPSAAESVSHGEAENETSDWITVKEAANRYPLSARWLYRKVGILSFVKRVGPKKILVHDQRLRRWLEMTD